jgi:hypothetical protein
MKEILPLGRSSLRFNKELTIILSSGRTIISSSPRSPRPLSLFQKDASSIDIILPRLDSILELATTSARKVSVIK